MIVPPHHTPHPAHATTHTPKPPHTRRVSAKQTTRQGQPKQNEPRAPTRTPTPKAQTPQANTPHPTTQRANTPTTSPAATPTQTQKRPRRGAWASKTCERGNPWQQGDRPERSADTRRGHADSAHNKARKQPGFAPCAPAPARGGRAAREKVGHA